MSEKPMSDLRRRMLEDMAVRKFGEKTRHDYIRHVEAFAKFLGRSPDTATAEDVRRFQVHLTESGVQPPTLNSSASALRFFFGITLDRAELVRHLARVHYPRKLPRVLSPEEVGRLLEAALRRRKNSRCLMTIARLRKGWPSLKMGTSILASKSCVSEPLKEVGDHYRTCLQCAVSSRRSRSDCGVAGPAPGLAIVFTSCRPCDLRTRTQVSTPAGNRPARLSLERTKIVVEQRR